jgi:hypothetical protein
LNIRNRYRKNTVHYYISQIEGLGKFPAGPEIVIDVVVVEPAPPQTGAAALLSETVAIAEVMVLNAFIFATTVLDDTPEGILTVISPSNPTRNCPVHVPAPEGHVHTKF